MAQSTGNNKNIHDLFKLISYVILKTNLSLLCEAPLSGMRSILLKGKTCILKWKMASFGKISFGIGINHIHKYIYSFLKINEVN